MTNNEVAAYNLVNKLSTKQSSLGFEYTIAALTIMLDDSSATSFKFTGDSGLYSKIASQKNTTAVRVEKAIRHFIGNCFSKQNPKFINVVEIFNFNKDSDTFNCTCKDFIISLNNYLKYNQ